MTADQFKGHVVRVTLGGPVEQRKVLDRLLADNEHVVGHAISEEGRLIAYLEPGYGELAFVQALAASGMYPLETYYQDVPDFGGHRAC